MMFVSDDLCPAYDLMKVKSLVIIYCNCWESDQYGWDVEEVQNIARPRLGATASVVPFQGRIVYKSI